MEAKAFELLPYQESAVNGGGRFTWNCWARQTGKSFTLLVREGRYVASWNCVCKETRQSVGFSDVELFAGD